jgi:CRISPR-associated endonuclease/helicase Cas3
VGFIVTGKSRLHQYDPTFADDESTESPTRVQVTLENHTRGVMACADHFIRGCGLARLAPQFALAARWHDVGKADPRFQAMLQGRSPRTARLPLLAKSGMPYQSKRERDAARAVHRYPKGARHEMLSVAVVSDRTDDNLILHLIASHHGDGRPFASEMIPSTDDPSAVFERHLLGEKFLLRPADLDPATVNGSVPERFWKFIREYGWWGSAYLEAVFRLADHAASRAEQENNYDPTKIPRVETSTVSISAVPRKLFPLSLPGLDGSNPLAFLAAVGAVLVADQLFPGARLRWDCLGKWEPVLELPAPVDEDEFAARAAEQLAKMSGHPAFTLGELNADNLIASPTAYRGLCQGAAAATSPERTLADYCAAFGSDAIQTDADPPLIQDTAFRTMSGAGHQHFLAFFRNIVGATQAAHLKKALFAEWRYDDPLKNLTTRWDPQDDVRYALRWKNPGDETKQRSVSGSVLGANRLAIEGLRLFPSVPSQVRHPLRLLTTGFRGSKSTDSFFSWPMWTTSATPEVVRSYLASGELQEEEPKVNRLRCLGVAQVFCSQRITQGKFRNFTLARPL